MNSGTHPNAYYGATTRPRLSHSDYTVACICPMGVELAPVRALLDQIHPPLPTKGNAYTLGLLGEHNIVVAVMPETGNNRAAIVATQLSNDFPSIRFALLVGIGGGIPGDNDIRLGDIVVSKPDQFGGVIQFDRGKQLSENEFQRTGQLDKPPAILSANVQLLEAQYLQEGFQFLSYFNAMLDKKPRMRERYQHPGVQHDQLFRSEFTHQGGNTCDNCNPAQTLSRPCRPDWEPTRVHYGTIGSSNVVIKDAVTRDKLGKEMGILCVEMEAAGLMDAFPCLVIRGICDYADSHKNNRWQPYAAAMAAAYAKELLMIIPPREVKTTQSVQEAARRSFRLGLHLGDAPAVEPHLFIGRKPELERMEAALKPNARGEERRIVVLGGTGGIGKTQLAIAFAKRYRENYDSVFWLNATSQGTLHASLHRLAQRILPLEGLKDCDDDRILSLVSRWLSETGNTRWLLIFDNYDEPDQYSIRKYYPSASHGSIITTTRLPDKVMGFSIKVQHLDRLEDGLDILQTRSGRSNVKSDPDAKRLAERLNGFPLALVTAGAFLRNNSIPFKTYLDKYEEQWNIVPNRPTKLPEYKESDTLYTTWSVSFTRLQEVDLEAAQLLTLLAYFDNKAIWYGLLRAGISETSPKWLTTVTEDDITFASPMNRLVEYCFVESHNEADSYSIHPCVHDWILHGLNGNVDQDKYWFALDCISLSIPPGDRNTPIQLKYRPLAFHAVRLCHPRFLGGGELNVARRGSSWKSVIIGRILQEQGQLLAASVWFERLLQRCEESVGLRAQATFEVAGLLGSAHMAIGKLAEAEKLYTRKLNKAEQEFGPIDRLTLIMVQALGNVYLNQGRLDEAKEKLNRALEGFQRFHSGEPMPAFETPDLLGTVYLRQGKLVEAEEVFKQALGKKEMVLGESDVKTLATCASLGQVYTKLGKFVEAENFLRRALQGLETKLGADHLFYLGVVRSEGELCWKQGKLAEAEKLLQGAFQGYKDKLGADDVDTIHTADMLGDVYMDQGKTVEAKEMYELAVLRSEGNAITAGMQGKEIYESVSYFSVKLGDLCQRMGMVDEAKQRYSRALQTSEIALGPSNEHCQWIKGRISAVERISYPCELKLVINVINSVN